MKQRLTQQQADDLEAGRTITVTLEQLEHLKQYARPGYAFHAEEDLVTREYRVRLTGPTEGNTMSTTDEITRGQQALEQINEEIARFQQEFERRDPLIPELDRLSALVMQRETIAQQLIERAEQFTNEVTEEDLKTVDSTNKEMAHRLAHSAYDDPQPSKSDDIALAGVFAQLAVVDALEALTAATKENTPSSGIQHSEIGVKNGLATTPDEITFYPPYDR